MSPVETYLLDLRAALGDRLPPALTEARLREARAHLLASAEDVGEAEAVLRYGRPRAVANSLVRTHRYDSSSAWTLTLSLVSFLIANTVFMTAALALGAPGDWLVFAPAFARTVTSVVAVLFLVRVIQIRRWLAGPMVFEHVLSLLILMALRHLQGMKGGWLSVELPLLVVSTFYMSAVWFALNTLGLGLGRLLDLQNVRRARSSR